MRIPAFIDIMAVTTAGQASTGTAPTPSRALSSGAVPTNKLSLRCKLLFAQAVHHLGAPIGKGVGINWNNIASRLHECAALSEDEKGLFTEHVSLSRMWYLSGLIG